MPGWHEATKQLQRDGKIQMVGIVEEQHPDRARLFMQWKGMTWPLLVDSYNLLGVPYVPITLAIDENGVIRAIHPPMQKPGEIDSSFVNQRFKSAPGPQPGRPAVPEVSTLRPADLAPALAWRQYGDVLALWGGDERLGEALSAYTQAARRDPRDAWAQFRLGGAYRKRYDSDARQPGDFRSAVEHWSAALEIDPNQYIFRRRIQQYRPRLDKPYSFYDWVVTARGEIEARGERAVELAVEPGGAEFATPLKTFDTSDAAGLESSDPGKRILDDKGRFIQIETVSVPAVIPPGGSARAHVVLRPNRKIKAHWNNEAEPLVFWMNPPPGWAVDGRAHRVPNPQVQVSQETRQVELEFRAPENAKPGTYFLPGYALYYVCEDVNGVCLYRRQDVTVEVTVKR